jgi:hypothetical protein
MQSGMMCPQQASTINVQRRATCPRGDSVPLSFHSLVTSSTDAVVASLAVAQQGTIAGDLRTGPTVRFGPASGGPSTNGRSLFVCDVLSTSRRHSQSPSVQPIIRVAAARKESRKRVALPGAVRVVGVRVVGLRHRHRPSSQFSTLAPALP